MEFATLGCQAVGWKEVGGQAVVVVGVEACEGGEEVVERAGQARHAAFAGLAGVVAEVGGVGGDLEDGLVGGLKGGRERR